MICTICYEDNNEKQKLYCGHIFCVTCIVKWKERNTSCPNCRQPMSKKYFKDKIKSEKNCKIRIGYIQRMISIIEKRGKDIINDHDELHQKRYELYEKLDILERSLN